MINISTYYIGSISCSGDDIYHYGVKGMKWGKHLFGLWDQYVTGSTAKRNIQRTQQNMNLNANSFVRGSKYSQERNWNNFSRSYQRNNDALRRYTNSYSNSLAGRMSNAYSQASKLAANAYSNAAKAVGGAGQNLSQFYSNAVARAQEAVNKGASIVAKYGSQAVANIQNLGKRSLENAQAFIDSILERRRKAELNYSKQEDENQSEAEGKRDYTPKLSGKTYDGTVNGSDEDEKKKKTKKKTTKSSKSSKSSGSSKSSSSNSEKDKKNKEKETKKLKKVYRSAQRMDLSPASTPGLPSYLQNLQNLKK